MRDPLNKTFDDLQRRHFGAPIEQTTDFDFEAVDDPEGQCMEELEAIARRRKLQVNITRDMAVMTLEWCASKGVGPSRIILHQAAAWIGGGKPKKDKYLEEVAVRASVFIYAFAPTARGSLSLGAIGQAYRISKSMTGKLFDNLRFSLSLKKHNGWRKRKQASQSSSIASYGGGVEGERA